MAYNAGAGLQGGLSGAAAGSSFGPWGALIGGGVGLLGGFLGNDKPRQDPATNALQAYSYDLFRQGQDLIYPAEAQTIQYATDPRQAGLAAQRGIENVDQQFQQQDSARQRMFALLGIQPTEAQGQALEKQSALGKAQAEAGAANLARRGTLGLQQQVLG